MLGISIGEIRESDLLAIEAAARELEKGPGVYRDASGRFCYNHSVGQSMEQASGLIHDLVQQLRKQRGK